MLNNSQFMKLLDIIMRHNHKTHEYYYHGTDLENAVGILKYGLYLRDDSSLSVIAVREFDEKGLFAFRDELPEEEIFEMEKNCLINYIYNRDSARGEECVVIIDKPKEEESIVKKVDKTNMSKIGSHYYAGDAEGLVDSKWIVGYVDKLNSKVVANPAYYDYDRIAKHFSCTKDEEFEVWI